MQEVFKEDSESFLKKLSGGLLLENDLFYTLKDQSNWYLPYIYDDYTNYIEILTSEQQVLVDKILNEYSYGTDRQEKIVATISAAMSNIAQEKLRIGIAFAVAQKDGRRAAEYFDLFLINDEISKVKIALVCSFTHARRISKHIKLFDIKQEELRFQIAYYAAFNNWSDVLQYLDNYNLSNIHFKKLVIARALLTTPHSIDFLNNIIWLNQIVHTANINEIREWLILASKKTGSIIPVSSSTLYDLMKRKDAWIKLLAWYILGQEGVVSPAQSLYQLTGFPCSHINDVDITSNSFWDFFEIILELQSKYLVPFFSRINLDKSLFSSSNFKTIIAFINVCNYLTQIRWSKAYYVYDSFINDIWDNLSISIVDSRLNIDVNNIQLIIDFIQDKFEKELTKLLESALNQDFDIKDFHKIHQVRWSDRQAFIALVARYSWKKDWNGAIPILLKIMNHVLNWSFEEYKYFGEDCLVDKELLFKQIWFLSNSDICERKKNSYRIDLIRHESELPLRYDDFVNSINSIWKKILIDDKYNKQDIWDILKFNDKELSKNLKIAYNNKNHMLLHCLDAVLDINANWFNIEDTKKVIWKIKSLKDLLLTDIEVKKQLDILSDKLRLKNSKNEVLFTTFFDDPRLMLSISNLMRVSSCFNYNNWVEIQALMSYVIDSNVKWLASFLIGASSFSSFSEFQLFCDIINSDSSKFMLFFDQSNRQLSFQSDRINFNIKLDDIFFKAFVKIWQTKDWDIGMKLETPSLQNHKMIDAIINKAMDLYQEKACAIWVHQDQSIRIPQSRSPLWSYSDLSAGRKIGGYIIE